MPSTRTHKDPNKKWYEDTVAKWVALISAFLLIAGVGYSFAVIQKTLEFKMEKYEMNQEFNRKLQDEINKCREEKQALENKRVDAIENVVSNLEKNYHGKQAK
jgi:polyhydroxyalkanoate synthesis regulator phasin